MARGELPVQPPAYTNNYQSTNNSRAPPRRHGTRSNTISSFDDEQNESVGPLPEDFEVFKQAISSVLEDDCHSHSQYGVTVSQCSSKIRNAFVRKVYLILRMSYFANFLNT